jgi:glycosyltransferase involved in cell wall biosynthesis
MDALFNQDFPKDQYEILISDDGSSDGTREYLAKLAQGSPVSFRYQLQEQSGPAKARNWGIRQARGDYIAFTDDDCIPPKDWLYRLMDAFGRYPDVVGVSGYQEADQALLAHNIYAQFEKYANMGDFMPNQQIEHVGGQDFLGGATNNVAYTRSVLLEVGGFDETFPYAAAEDADLKKRIVDRGYKMVHLPLMVLHKHQYSYRNLMRQAYVRGYSSRHFNIKHHRPNSPMRFFLSVGKITMRSLGLLFTRYWRLLPLVLLYQINFMRGVLDYAPDKYSSSPKK